MKKTTGLVLVVCLISALVMAETAGEKKAEQKDKKADISASQRDPRTFGRRGTPADRQRMYKEMLAKRYENHKKAIEELEAIKKIAEEEKASRTVEALQKMIDKKNEEFKQRMEQFEQQRRNRPKRAPQRGEKESPEKTKSNSAENK
jgi:hypothetical protein